jgi:SAM-dependent methyltransferase
MNDRIRLVLLSFLMLFVELALIRWTGSNVVYLSYFSNFVLLGSFLGIGLGFLRANKPRNLFPLAPVALLVLVAFVRFVPVDIERSGGDLIFFGGPNASGPPREVVLPVIFIVVAAAMTFIAEGVARTFVRFEPLEAYRLDLIGSVAGILGFSVLSFLRMPPLAWGVIAGVTLLALERPRLTRANRPRTLSVLQVISVVGVVVILAAESLAAGTSWSPYYKIETSTNEETGTTSVDVNGVPHQSNLGTEQNPLYALVYETARPASLENVLVIGAGGGNDVAAALARGAEHVDAVEIDPRIYEIGKDTHPEQPYDDDRVDVHIDDGRAYLERTSEQYDLIVFALPDSITLVSGQSSLRLESYLFTKEALETAKDRLTPNGVFAMYNFYREDWLVDRLGGMLQDVYGKPPCIGRIGQEDGPNNLVVLAETAADSNVACPSRWRPLTGSVPEAVTDDHPFPYLRDRSIPIFYVVTIALILLASIVFVRIGAGALRPMANYVDLFFMGAAFLLLETKSVVQFALLFGTTWFVNALVFLGILVSVLAAVEVSRRITFRRPARLYAVLLATLVAAFVIPQHALLGLTPPLRFVAATVLAFAPIFTANLVFTQRFKDVSASASAFGANLIGAMFGGLLEYSALIVGYRALLVAVAVLYGLAFLFGRRYLVAEASEAPPPVAARSTQTV